MVLINPFSALTLFLDLTRGYSMNNRRKVARVACLTIFITISFFTVAGETLLKALGISIGSFQLAGGILVFLISLNMMNGEGNPVKPDQENFDVDHVQDALPTMASAVVPIAIPMMIGPGGISTVIIYSSQVSGILQVSAIICTIIYVRNAYSYDFNTSRSIIGNLIKPYTNIIIGYAVILTFNNFYLRGKTKLANMKNML